MITASVIASLTILGTQQSEIKSATFEGKITKRLQLGYLSYVPDDYATSNKKYPLVLFLHGSGERGSDLELVKKHGPMKEIAGGKRKGLPFVIIAPQCPERRSWDVDELIGLLNEVEKKFRIDRNREFVSGLSMGGYGTWALLAAQPKRFAGAIPICGGGDPKAASTFAKVPIWVIHGDKDPAVPFQQSVDMVNALKAAGGDPIFTQVVGGTHDVWTSIFEDDGFYKFVMTHKR